MRDFDIIVLGATGFTGQLVVEYLTKTYPTGLRWAIAGRNEGKLQDLRTKLKVSDSVGVVVADSSDQKSLDAVASRTKVIVSTAGPYALIGTTVVDACVRCNTHYCDITGEGPWVRTIIDLYHEEASKKKLRIVNCCGFDCIPADMGTMMMVDEMKKRSIVPTEIRFICKETVGGLSGGTAASILNIFACMTTKSAIDSTDPYFLAPRDELSNKPLRATDPKVAALNYDSFSFSYDKIVGKWMMPWIMQAIDTRIVNRSNALTGWRYGRNLVYRELAQAPNMIVAAIGSALFPIVGAMLYFSLTRSIIKYVLPKQGDGPNQYLLDNGLMKILFWGRGNNTEGAEVVVTGGVQAMHGDPGYRQTAKFVAEAGISLALDSSSLPDMYGVLTPSTAMGTVLLEKLRAKGVDFYIGEHRA